MSEIANDVSDVYNTAFEYYKINTVPNSHNSGLTFENGETKIGRALETCVLFVDIRNSVALTQKHHSNTMAKIYTAFIKAVIKIGRHHGASTRNIIGDRVMLVFPSNKCFHNSVSCAISINYIASKIIKKQFPGVDFKCGIGIDYGKLKVLKVGLQRNGIEKSENKGLVWTGYPANYASRLTDMANKVITTVKFKVNFNGYKNPFALLGFPFDSELTNLPLSRSYRESDSPYNYIPTEQEWDATKFADSIEMDNQGQIKFKEGKLNGLERIEEKIKYPSILFTQAILSGLNQENSLRFNDKWELQKGEFKDITGKIYGGDYVWSL